MSPRPPDGRVPARGPSTPTDAVAAARLRDVAGRAPGLISVEPAALGAPASWSPPLQRPPDLRAATFDRALDDYWRRTSYSDITAGAHEPRVASEPEQDLLADEPEP